MIYTLVAVVVENKDKCTHFQIVPQDQEKKILLNCAKPQKTLWIILWIKQEFCGYVENRPRLIQKAPVLSTSRLLTNGRLLTEGQQLCQPHG